MSGRFAPNRTDAILLDMLAKRYGGLPTDYLKLPVVELSQNLRIALIGIDNETKQQDAAMAEAEAKSKLKNRSN